MVRPINKISGVFNYFYQAKRGQKGQVAAFLIVIIVVLLVAAMALVNIGKVSTYRLDTAKASDAGALAGASTLASTQNTIANENLKLIRIAGLVSAIFSLGLFRPLWMEWIYYNIFMYYQFWLLMKYLSLLYLGYRGMKSARGTAHQFAFSNVGIDEVEIREAGTEKRLPSPFSKWVKDQELANESEVIYRWQQYSFNLEERKQEKEVPENWVKSKVQLPGERLFILIPWPVLPLPIIYYHKIPPCDKDACAACNAAKLYAWGKYYKIKGYEDWATRAKNKVGIDTPQSGTTSAEISGVSRFGRWIINYITNRAYNRRLISARWLVQPECGVKAKLLVIYWLCIPWIMAMTPNSPEIKVDVTRYYPEKNLGLWRSDAQELKSGADGKSYGGLVFWPKPEYRAKIRRTR